MTTASENTYIRLLHGTADLYVFFYERSVKLLNPEGVSVRHHLEQMVSRQIRTRAAPVHGDAHGAGTSSTLATKQFLLPSPIPPSSLPPDARSRFTRRRQPTWYAC